MKIQAEPEVQFDVQDIEGYDGNILMSTPKLSSLSKYEVLCNYPFNI